MRLKNSHTQMHHELLVMETETDNLISDQSHDVLKSDTGHKKLSPVFFYCKVLMFFTK
jgi:hypothetical protein